MTAWPNSCAVLPSTGPKRHTSPMRDRSGAGAVAAAGAGSRSPWSRPASWPKLVVVDNDDRPKTAAPALSTVAPPTSFLAEVGGRLAVVSTTSGRVIRFLTKAPAGRLAYALSEDRNTVWFSNLSDCQAPSGLYRVPYQGGKAVKVDKTVNTESIAVSWDGSKIAYRPYSCSGPSIAIAVLDLRTGKKRTWSYSPGNAGSIDSIGSMTWSPDGRHLTYLDFFAPGNQRTRAWLLDTLGPGTSLGASKAVLAPDKSCDVRDLAWQPGSGLLAISETCPASHQLVYVNAPGGRTVSRPLQSSRPIVGLDFDPSGRHLLYTDAPNVLASSETMIWRYDGTRAVEIGTHLGEPAW